MTSTAESRWEDLFNSEAKLVTLFDKLSEAVPGIVTDFCRLVNTAGQSESAADELRVMLASSPATVRLLAVTANVAVLRAVLHKNMLTGGGAP